MRIRATLVAATGALALLTAACGGGGDNNTADSAARRVEITMQDTAFAPSEVTVQPGETVQFVFHNTGAIAHDAYIGDEAAQADHEAEMRNSSGGMDMGHHSDSGDGAITVEPGETGTLTHTFRSGDQLLIGCHEQGHYAAGMKLAIDVS